MLETCDWWKADATAKDTRDASDRCKITSRFCRVFPWLFIRFLSCTASWTVVVICRLKTIPAIGPEKYRWTSVKNAYVATDTSVRRTGLGEWTKEKEKERVREIERECEKGKRKEEEGRGYSVKHQSTDVLQTYRTCAAEHTDENTCCDTRANFTVCLRMF